MVVCDNGTPCPGEHAFASMLYRLAYPYRLIDLQDIFRREFSQYSRNFNQNVDLMYDKHKHKVEGNLSWYSERFDMYRQAVIKKIISSPRNPNRGYMHHTLRWV